MHTDCNLTRSRACLTDASVMISSSVVLFWSPVLWFSAHWFDLAIFRDTTSRWTPASRKAIPAVKSLCPSSPGSIRGSCAEANASTRGYGKIEEGGRKMSNSAVVASRELDNIGIGSDIKTITEGRSAFRGLVLYCIMYNFYFFYKSVQQISISLIA